jgi:hypothetical protein
VRTVRNSRTAPPTLPPPPAVDQRIAAVYPHNDHVPTAAADPFADRLPACCCCYALCGSPQGLHDDGGGGDHRRSLIASDLPPRGGDGQVVAAAATIGHVTRECAHGPRSAGPANARYAAAAARPGDADDAPAPY